MFRKYTGFSLKASKEYYMKKLIFAALAAVFSLASCGRCIPVGLECEHLSGPLGIDEAFPRLSWHIEDGRAAAPQTAWRIVAGTDRAAVAKGSGDMWDTGKTDGETMLVRYAGRPLEPFTEYWWSVTVWDKDGKPRTSAPASFETGMMGMENWTGEWIDDGKDIEFLPAPYFRKEFVLGNRPGKARAYIAAAGLYELYINGKKVGDHVLDPLFTRFDRRNLYVTYDVTELLEKGENAVGVLLGNGWYNHQSGAVWDFDRAPWRDRPAFCLDLRIEDADGNVAVISSGTDWKVGYGPLVLNSIYTSEHYDARLKNDGWAKPGFDDGEWIAAEKRAAPSSNVTAQTAVPIRAVKEYGTAEFRKLNEEGTDWLFDFGQNMSGFVRLKASGEEGTVLKLIHAERIDSEGHADQSNIDIFFRPKHDNDFFQTDVVILGGNGEDEFMPAFNYKGFRYVEVVSDRPVELGKNSLTAYFVHSDVAPAGKVSSSDKLLEKIWEAANMSYLSNLMGYPTDCPQREKNGWTGDGHIAIETGLYNFNGMTVYEKWLADHRDEQRPDGVLPDIIPTGGWGYGTDNGLDWTSTIALIPWTLYTFTGDIKPLEDCYENIKRYVDYVDSDSPDGLSSWGRGDWVPVRSRSSKELTSSVYFFADAKILAEAARLLGRDDDAAYYSALAVKIRNAINDKYLDREKGIYASGSQTELAMPLYWGIVPAEAAPAVAANLATNVQEQGYHPDTGILGARALLSALSDNGYHETAYRLAVQDTHPSWGNWIVNGGATTLLEHWLIEARNDASDNHIMFGDIGAWIFRSLAGIKPDPERPGFRHIILRPAFCGPEELAVSHTSPFGEIVTSWTIKDGRVKYRAEIPAGCSATLFLPDGICGKDGKNAPVELSAGHHSLIFKK